MDTKKLLLAAISFTALVAAGCNTNSQDSFSVRALPAADDPLAIAVEYTPNLSEVAARRESYLEIANGYLARGDASTAVALADHVRARIAESENSAEARILLDLAVLYADLSMNDAATTLMLSALDALDRVSGDAERTAIIRRVITTTFALGDGGFEVLSSAIEQVFVIETLWRRVELLMDTAETYIEEGSPQSVNSLIQQALPAAGSIEDGHRRAAALGSIAAVYSRLGEEGRAEEMLTRALEVLPSAGAEIGEEESEAILRLVEAILGMGQPYRALTVVNRIPNAAERAEGVRRIAEAYSESATPSAAYIVLSQAARSAETASDPYTEALALARIADGYRAVGDLQVATIRAEAALRALREVSDVERQVEVRRTLLPVLIAAEAYDRVVTLPDPIGELSDYLTFSAETAVALLEANEESAAAQVLSATSGRIAQSDGGAATGLADLSWAYARATDRSRSLSTLTRIAELPVLISGLRRVGSILTPPFEESALEQLELIREQIRMLTQPL